MMKEDYMSITIVAVVAIIGMFVMFGGNGTVEEVGENNANIGGEAIKVSPQVSNDVVKDLKFHEVLNTSFVINGSNVSTVFDDGGFDPYEKSHEFIFPGNVSLLERCYGDVLAEYECVEQNYTVDCYEHIVDCQYGCELGECNTNTLR